MKRKDEDRIIKILNENIKVDLEKNYTSIREKLIISSKDNKIKSYRYLKLSLSLSLVLIVVFFSLILSNGMLSFRKDKAGSELLGLEEIIEERNSYPISGEKYSSIEESIYAGKIRDDLSGSGIEEYILYANSLSKSDIEKLFSEYGINDTILHEYNSYAASIVIKEGREYFSYTNGSEVKMYLLDIDYSISDIYTVIKRRISVNYISLKVSNENIVYYGDDGNSIIEITK